MVTPSSVRKEGISRSVPSLAGRSVAVDGAGLVGLVLVVLGRRPHHVALVGLERVELLAALHGYVDPGSPGRATGSGATYGEVITERDVLINTLAVVGLIARQEEAVPGVPPDPGAVFDTGGVAVAAPPVRPPGRLDRDTAPLPAPASLALPHPTARPLQGRPGLLHPPPVSTLEGGADGLVLLHRPGPLQPLEEEPALLLGRDEVSRYSVGLVVVPERGLAGSVPQALQTSGLIVTQELGLARDSHHCTWT